MTDEELYRIAGILHEARMTECYGNWQMSSRKAWPATFKEFRAQRQAGQPWIDVAIAQAMAIEPLLAITQAENSCGCVFCDIELEPFNAEGIFWHQVAGHDPVRCTNPRFVRQSKGRTPPHQKVRPPDER